MKKLLSVLVCLLIVFAPVVAAAQPDAQSLEEYIRDEYGLEVGEYELGDPWVIEFDGRTYYVYYIYGATREDYFKGDIVWVEEEQRFIGWEEFYLVLEDYYQLQQQIWEELQQQAGKMDAWLYSQLLEMDRNEEVEIYILPRFELTPELEQEIRELFLKYNLDPPEDFRWWWSPGVIVSNEPTTSREPAGSVPPGAPGDQDGQDGPGSPDDPDSDDSEGNEGEGQPDSEEGNEGEEGDETGDNGSDDQGQDPDDGDADAEEPDGDGDVDGDQTDPYTGDEDGDDGDDGDWDVWIDPVDEEFYNELARLYAKGFDASRKRLETALKSANADYSFDGMGFMVTTTAGFALDLRDNEDVEWIGGLFYAYAHTDDGSRESMPAVVTGLRDAAYNLEFPSGFETPWFLIGGLGLVMAGLVWLVIKKF